MRYITTLIISILWVLSSHAQEFGTHWISYPLPNDSSEVWFRQSYIMNECPTQAFMNIASTGNYKLYINERNVTGSLKFDGIKDSILLNRTIDVTRFLKNGENVIAVWYAPQGKPSYGKQLSLEFYGWQQDSIPFYQKADGKWFCRQLKECSNGEGERFHAHTNTQAWKSEEYHPYGWIHPTGCVITDEYRQDSAYVMNYKAFGDKKVIKDENKLYKILKPACTYRDSTGYNIDFGRPFYGTIRLTLRGAGKGTRLKINDFLYICNGELDEQAFCRFKFSKQKIYTLTRKGRFKESDIVDIEGLEISE